MALDVASGEVIGETYKRHRHQEVLKFLRQKAVPKDQEIHIILQLRDPQALGCWRIERQAGLPAASAS